MSAVLDPFLCIPGASAKPGVPARGIIAACFPWVHDECQAITQPISGNVRQSTGHPLKQVTWQGKSLVMCPGHCQRIHWRLSEGRYVLPRPSIDSRACVDHMWYKPVRELL